MTNNEQNAQKVFNPSSLYSLSLNVIVLHKFEEFMKLPLHTRNRVCRMSTNRSHWREAPCTDAALEIAKALDHLVTNVLADNAEKVQEQLTSSTEALHKVLTEHSENFCTKNCRGREGTAEEDESIADTLIRAMSFRRHINLYRDEAIRSIDKVIQQLIYFLGDYM